MFIENRRGHYSFLGRILRPEEYSYKKSISPTNYTNGFHNVGDRVFRAARFVFGRILLQVAIRRTKWR